MVRQLAFVLVALASCTLFGGCATSEAMLTLKPDSLQLRQQQTKRFDTGDEGSILTACAALLQDLGFKIDETEPAIGLLSGSKRRSAKDVKEIVVKVVVGVLLGGQNIPYSDEQIMRALVVTKRAGSDKSHSVRVTFQRTVFNSDKRLSKMEDLQEPEMYQMFFEKLSKALFLEAHDI